jgi:hypothetical protein
VTLNFRYGGVYRTDIAFYQDGQPIGFTEANKNKGSFRIYFDISLSKTGHAGPSGINISKENFRLTPPSGPDIVDFKCYPVVGLYDDGTKYYEKKPSVPRSTPQPPEITL